MPISLPLLALVQAGGRHALAMRVPGFGSDASRSKFMQASLDTPGPGRCAVLFFCFRVLLGF